MKIIYDIFISILAILATILAVIDLYTDLSPTLIILDKIVLIIFIFDYFIRLFISKNKKEFFINNIFDLISIIPFNSIFRAFRLAKLVRLTKIAKITKLSRLVVFSARFISKVKIFLNTNGFKYMLLLTSFLILIGGISIHFAEDMSLADGIWWAFVTATTVGYGDISPATSFGRIIATVLMLIGIGLIGSLTSTISSYFTNKTKKNIVDKTLNEIISDGDLKKLSDEDVDALCNILKKMNK